MFRRLEDFFHIVRRTLRFPTSSLDLKSIGKHIGVVRKSKIRHELESSLIYFKYQQSQNKRTRQHYKRQLLAYNHNDLMALPALIRYCGEV